VGSALGKLVRALPAPVAGPVDAVRRVRSRRTGPAPAGPSPETTAQLVQACSASRRLRLGYHLGPERDRVLDVDPWAVVVRRRRWYLLCWSHTSGARRVLRVDRVTSLAALADTFVPPTDLDPVRALEEHLSEGWRHQVEVVVDAPADDVAGWIPRSLGRVEALDPETSRLVGSTDEPDWYAEQLTAIRAPFRVAAPRELTQAVHALGQRLVRAGDPAPLEGRGS
jgi:predicted DNA-binding transcriptional regulator YafY